MQQDDAFIWLLDQLKHSVKDFQTMYNVQFFINDIIILRNSEPKFWYYMDSKNQIQLKDDEWLKFRAIKEFFSNPKITINEINEIEQNAEHIIGNTYENKPNNDIPDKILFYFISPTEDKQYAMRPATDLVIEELCRKNQDFNSYLSSWTKIIGYYPLNDQKNPCLYNVNYTYNNGEKKSKTNIIRKKLEKQQLLKEEFLKTEKKASVFKFSEQKAYKSLAASINEKCDLLICSLVRFIETKFQMLIKELQIEFFILDNGTMWLSGCDKIDLCFKDGQPYQGDLASLTPTKLKKKSLFQCPGLYCGCKSDNIFYEENEEAFNLYIQPQDQKLRTNYFVQYKSIILDIIERQKTLQAIKKASPDISCTELLLYKFRIYYSISRLLVDPNFKHFRTDNLYQRVRVCYFCFNMYEKIDSQRIQRLEKKTKQVVTAEAIQQFLNQLLNSQGNIYGPLMSQNKQNKMFSKDFFGKLVGFDTELDKFNENYDVIQFNDENYYTRKFKHMHQVISDPNFFNYAEEMSNQVDQQDGQTKKSEQNYQLPKIKCQILTDKDRYIKKRKFQVSRSDAESIGIKHFLGHTKNLPKSEYGLAISRSSLQLNKLSDKIGQIKLLKDKIEKKKLSSIKQEIEQIFCPYFGKGEQDMIRLKDFIDTLNQREADYALDNEEKLELCKRIQILTDKVEFLTEKEKQKKEDRENRQKELEKNRKNFLETNCDLAKSILKLRQSQHNISNNNNIVNSNSLEFQELSQSQQLTKSKNKYQFKINLVTPESPKQN